MLTRHVHRFFIDTPQVLVSTSARKGSSSMRSNGSATSTVRASESTSDSTSSATANSAIANGKQKTSWAKNHGWDYGVIRFNKAISASLLTLSTALYSFLLGRSQLRLSQAVEFGSRRQKQLYHPLLILTPRLLIGRLRKRLEEVWDERVHLLQPTSGVIPSLLVALVPGEVKGTLTLQRPLFGRLTWTISSSTCFPHLPLHAHFCGKVIISIAK